MPDTPARRTPLRGAAAADTIALMPPNAGSPAEPIRRRNSSGLIRTASARLRKLSVNMACSPGCKRRSNPARFIPIASAKEA